MNKIIKSLGFSNQEILKDIIDLHVPEGIEVDMTFGNGSFYKELNNVPKFCYDVEPLQPHVIETDSRRLPLDDESVKSVIFDPPFLTYVKNGRKHKDGNVLITNRFGGYWTYDDLSSHYTDSIKEASRILQKKGIFIVKCQDIIHNHRMHCTHFNVIEWAKNYFRLKDLFVLGAKHRMPSPQKGKQRHARIYHSYFLVFEKA